MNLPSAASFPFRFNKDYLLFQSSVDLVADEDKVRQLHLSGQWNFSPLQ
jgi:hypothetical protein